MKTIRFRLNTENVYEVGYEWVAHSLAPTSVPMDQMRIKSAALPANNPTKPAFERSAMSYGALSKTRFGPQRWS